jgi:hypothetical protein
MRVPCTSKFSINPTYASLHLPPSLLRVLCSSFCGVLCTDFGGRYDSVLCDAPNRAQTHTRLSRAHTLTFCSYELASPSLISSLLLFVCLHVLTSFPLSLLPVALSVRKPDIKALTDLKWKVAPVVTDIPVESMIISFYKPAEYWYAPACYAVLCCALCPVARALFPLLTIWVFVCACFHSTAGRS